MKIVLSYIFIVLGLAALTLATSRPAMRYVWEHKYQGKYWWGEHVTGYGDLSQMAYLDNNRKFQTPKDYVFNRSADSSVPGNIDLYVYGDSYTEEVPGYVFSHVDSYTYATSNYSDLYYRLEGRRWKILVIEKTERNLRFDFRDNDIFNHLRKKEEHTSFDYREIAAHKKYAMLTLGIELDNLFNPKMNQSLEYLLFNMNFENGMRCLKADLNYQWFNRASGDVVISDDGSHLFLRETLVPRGTHSSYTPFPNDSVEHYVSRFNEIYDHYRREGFDEVYLSIIPCPVSVIQPEGYNNLIPALQQHPGMKMKLIDLYSKIYACGDPRRFYRAGDTHWNNTGMQAWLQLMNEMLSSESRKSAADTVANH